jgi:transposase InsO family protein
MALCRCSPLYHVAKDFTQAWASVFVAKPFVGQSGRWENGYCESFNARFWDELLNGEVFTTLHEAQILIERWRRHYNTVKPHSDLGYRPPVPKSIVR